MLYLIKNKFRLFKAKFTNENALQLSDKWQDSSLTLKKIILNNQLQ